MTSKEALQIIRDYHNEIIYSIDYVYTDNIFEQELDVIEKDLKVLEILKNNEILISYIEQSKSYDDYISKCDCFRCLSYITEKEYTLLKERLGNDN